jgi:glycosyltransferase involved in cell wall biosynthesis
MVSRRQWLWHKSKPAGPGRPFVLDRPAAAPTSGEKGQDPDSAFEPHEVEPHSTGRGQRLLFINQYYWPDEASTAQHLADLAAALATQGYECHVLCSRGSYQSRSQRPPAHEVHDGVHIHRIWATSLGRRGTWSRMTDYLSFYVGALIRVLLLPRFDLVVTLTTPPLIGMVGVLLRRLRRSRHVVWSMDVHPDASLALQRMSSTSLFGRLMDWVSRLVYRQADRVVVLGPYMADRVALKNVPPDHITTIPVWSRRDEVYPIPRGANQLRRSLGLGPTFVAMYSGNMGLAHSFDEILEAARRLRDRRDIVFLLVGGGPRQGEIKAAIESEGLDNIRLFDSFPRGSLHVSLSLADVHLISMRAEMTGIVVPGKLYGAMAAGRPAVFIGPEHCETADTIRSAGCGTTVKNGDATGVVEALEFLSTNPGASRRMGEKARSAFVAHYEQKLCCSHWSRLVSELVSHAGRQRPEPVSPSLHLQHNVRDAGARAAGILNHSGQRQAGGPFDRDRLSWGIRIQGSTS